MLQTSAWFYSTYIVQNMMKILTIKVLNIYFWSASVDRLLFNVMLVCVLGLSALTSCSICLTSSSTFLYNNCCIYSYYGKVSLCLFTEVFMLFKFWNSRCLCFLLIISINTSIVLFHHCRRGSIEKLPFCEWLRLTPLSVNDHVITLVCNKLAVLIWLACKQLTFHCPYYHIKIYSKMFSSVFAALHGLGDNNMYGKLNRIQNEVNAS